MIDNHTALIVDDASRFTDQALFGPNDQVMYAVDSESAMAVLHEHPEVSTVLINLEASAKNGLALVSSLRAGQGSRVPAIGFCADPDDVQTIDRVLEARVEELILRPFNIALLRHHAQKLQRLHTCRVALDNQARAHDLDSLIDSLSTGVGIFEYSHGRMRTLYVNGAFLLGAKGLIEVSKLYDDNAVSALTAENAKAVLAALENHLQNGAPIDLPLHVKGWNGSEMSVRLQGLPIRYEGRSTPVFLVSITDISSQHRAERALTESSRQLDSLMNAVPGGIAMFDLSGKPRILYANDGLHAMCGYDAQEYRQLMEEDFHHLIDPRDHELMDRLLSEFRANPQHMEAFFRALTKNRQVRWMRITVSPYGEGLCCNAVFIDVTHDKEVEAKNERMRSELCYRAEFDVLTGISNRDAFYRQTSDLLRAHPDTAYVILMMDIDRFKVVNDMFGKEVGDRILIAIANGLKHLLNGIGTYARMEADHFAACFPQRLLDMEKILHLFDIGLKRQKLDYHIQLSLGIYQIRNINVPINHMCDRAAMALKTIKGSVVQRYAFYDDKLRQELLDENAILAEMSDALSQGQFVPYLQPIFTVDTHQPVSVEMLVRWDHPKKGLIPPARFVPLFERNGFITRLDFYIWEKACELLSLWRDNGYPLPVSVNISRIDLYCPHLCEQLLELTAKYGVPPSMLRLEITESAYSKDPEELVEIINRLRANGFIILMDDFGSGYSSLNVLMDMPVDILKLDMRFMTKLDTNQRAGSILTSVVRMAKWLHMPVVAEGVSTIEQLTFLRSIGCDHAQGFLFAKPMSVAEYTQRYLSTQSTPPTAPPVLQREPVDLSCLWDVSVQADAMFNGMVGGMGIYELCGDTLEIRRVNDGYYELFGCTPKQVFDGEREALFTVHPDDREGLFNVCRRAGQSGRVERFVCRHIHSRNLRQMWLEARIRFMGKAGSNDVFCFTFSDVTEQREFEQSLALRNYAMLLRTVYSTVYELNMTQRRCRMVCSPEGEPAAEPSEQPLALLQAELARILPTRDEEIHDRIFT